MVRFWEEVKAMKSFYLLSGLDALAGIAYAFEIIYLISIGFSTASLGILFTITSLLIMIFMVPVGVIADIRSRKLSVFLSYVINSFGVLILALTSNHAWIIASFIIGAFSFALRSNALSAWMIDYFEQKFPEAKTAKVISRDKSINSLAGFFVFLLSSLILFLLKDSLGLTGSIRYMYWISTLTFISMSIITLFTHEYYFRKKEPGSYFKSTLREARHVLRQSFNTIRESEKLRYMFIGGFILVFGSTIISYVWPLHFLNNGIDESLYGVILAFYNLIGFTIISLNEPLKKLARGRLNLIIISAILMGIFYIVFGQDLGYYLIIIFLVLSAFWDLLFNNFFIRLNKLIPSEVRATAVSLINITDNFSETLSKLILFGLATPLLGINASVIIGGVLVIISGFILLKSK